MTVSRFLFTLQSSNSYKSFGASAKVEALFIPMSRGMQVAEKNTKNNESEICPHNYIGTYHSCSAG